MRVQPFMRGVGHVWPGSGMRYPSSTYEGLGKRQQWGKGGHSHPAKKAKLDTPAKMAEAETDTNKSKAGKLQYTSTSKIDALNAVY